MSRSAANKSAAIARYNLGLASTDSQGGITDEVQAHT